jgi:hypothetical protein
MIQSPLAADQAACCIGATSLIRDDTRALVPQLLIAESDVYLCRYRRPPHDLGRHHPSRR